MILGVVVFLKGYKKMLTQETNTASDKSMNQIRAVLYARVSSDDKAKTGSRNILGQLDDCREYAKEKGYTIIDELREDDRGASGAELDLPELNKIRAMAEKKLFDVLIVREMDRLSRNLAKQLLIEDELKRNRVTIDYVLEEYADTLEGEMSKNLRAVIAEYERGKIRERLYRGKVKKAQNGGNVISKPAYGYRFRNVDNQAVIEIHELEARVVRNVFNWYVEGDSVADILKRVHGQNIKTPTGKDKWRRSTVYSILKRETYTGTMRWNEHIINVPPIISRETFFKAKQQMKHNTIHNKRNRKHEYLLATRCKCQKCGSAMCGNTNTSRQPHHKSYAYYRCLAVVKQNKKTCDSPAFNVNAVDAAVWNWLVNLLDNIDNVREGYKKHQEQVKKDLEPIRAEMVSLNRLIEVEKRKLDKILDLYLDSDDLTKDLLTERRKRYTDTITSLQLELEELEQKIEQQEVPDSAIDSVLEYAARIGEGLKNAEDTFEARRWLVETLDVTGELFLNELGEKMVKVKCVLRPDGDDVVVMSNSTD